MSSPYPINEINKNYISGEWVDGGSSSVNDVFNPYDNEKISSIRMANASDLNRAYAAADHAYSSWRSMAPSHRREILLKVASIIDQRHDELVDWLVKESGSTRLKAEIEINSARSITLEAASFPTRMYGRVLESDVPGKTSHAYRKPIGVVGVVSPWNFPFHLTQRTVAPAIALGNTVVIKPASDTPFTGAILIAKIFEEAGLPAGVLNVVVGSGSEIGDAFVQHKVPSLISFTGSTPVGIDISRNNGVSVPLKHLALELGGNNPFIVLNGCDVDQAVKAAVFGKFLHQGQICMSINRIIVENDIYDLFVEKFVSHVKNLSVGDPALFETNIGPVINKKQLNGLIDKVNQAKAEGARLMLASEVVGNFMPPHVFSEVDPNMSIAREEIFGPLVGIICAKDADQAFEFANLSDFGLTASVFCSDNADSLAVSSKIKSGMIHINDIPVADEVNAPFGGEKNSGIGRFNGDWAIEEFTQTQWVTVQNTQREYPF